MEGRIYISSAFTNLKYDKCKPNSNWLDNDPHFWNSPPTWGICRSDFRKIINKGDYVFFVLPKHSDQPQMIYGYIKVSTTCDHLTAFTTLPQKRMNGNNPNGNIIVDANGNYNFYDRNAHFDRFHEIKKYYVIGDINHSKFLTLVEIHKLAPTFLKTLQQIFNSSTNNIFGIIGRKGRKLSEIQIDQLLAWIG